MAFARGDLTVREVPIRGFAGLGQVESLTATQLVPTETTKTFWTNAVVWNSLADFLADVPHARINIALLAALQIPKFAPLPDVITFGEKPISSVPNEALAYALGIEAPIQGAWIQRLIGEGTLNQYGHATKATKDEIAALKTREPFATLDSMIRREGVRPIVHVVQKLVRGWSEEITSAEESSVILSAPQAIDTQLYPMRAVFGTFSSYSSYGHYDLQVMDSFNLICYLWAASSLHENLDEFKSRLIQKVRSGGLGGYKQTYDGVPDVINTLIGLVKGYPTAIADSVLSRIGQFQAKKPRAMVRFNEVYGISDIANIPPRTISYAVVNDPPPVPENQWKNVQMWSALFNTDFGKTILQAAVMLFPVRTRVPLKIEDTGVIEVVRQRTSDYKMTQWTIDYIIKDFIIEVDNKQSILVKYDFSAARAQYTDIQMRERDDAFKTILIGVGFVVGTLLAVKGIAAAIGQLGTAGSLGTTGVGTAGTAGITTGGEITLGSQLVGKFTAPALTGIPTIQMPSSIVAMAGELGMTLPTTGAALTSGSKYFFTGLPSIVGSSEWMGSAAAIANKATQPSLWQQAISTIQKVSKLTSTGFKLASALQTGAGAGGKGEALQLSPAEIAAMQEQERLAYEQYLLATGQKPVTQAGMFGDPKLLLALMFGAGLLIFALTPSPEKVKYRYRDKKSPKPSTKRRRK